MTDKKGAEAVAAALGSSAYARLVALLWIALPLIATQVPQRNAPQITADGPGRADLLMAAAHGLDRIGDSTPFWLLVAATLVAIAARVLLPSAARAASRTVPLASGSDPSGAVERALRRRLGSMRSGRWSAVRSRVGASGRVIACGWRQPGLALLAVGAAALAGTVARAAHTESPTILEVPRGTGGRAAPIEGRRVEAGRLVPVTGYAEAGCDPSAGAIVCRLDVLGQQGVVELAPGRSAALGPYRVTWTATSATPAATAPGLRWTLADAAGKPARYAFNVADGSRTKVPSLGLTLSTFAHRGAGPVLVGTRDVGLRHEALLVAGGGLLPAAEPLVQARAAGRVRLLVARPGSPLLTLAALLVLALGALLAFALPALTVRIDRADSVAVLTGANRSELRAAVLRALAPVAATEAKS